VMIDETRVGVIHKLLDDSSLT